MRPAKIKVNIGIRSDQFIEMKRVAEETRVPMSAHIRAALDLYMKVDPIVRAAALAQSDTGSE